MKNWICVNNTGNIDTFKESLIFILKTICVYIIYAFILKIYLSLKQHILFQIQLYIATYRAIHVYDSTDIQLFFIKYS